MVWISLLPAGSSFPGTHAAGAGAQASTPTGAPVGTQVKLSTGLVNGDRPDVCVDTSGRPVAVWTSVDGFPALRGQPQGGVAAPVDGRGRPHRTAETVVAPPTATSAQPAVSCGSGSTFVVVWHSDQPPAVERADILGLRFSRLGRPVGKRLPGQRHGDREQRNPSIAHDAKGNFVVVWQASVSLEQVGIYGRRFTRGRRGLSPDFEVVSGPGNATSAEPSRYRDIGTAGNFVVVWQAGAQAIYGRRFIP